MAVGGGTVDVGTGTTIVFGTTGYTAELLSISWSGMARDAIETTHMATDTTPGTTEFGSATFMAVDIADGGTVTAEVHFNPDTTPPLGDTYTAETITITFPKYGTDATAANWAFSGFCTTFEVSAPMEDKMTATLTIRVTGGVTITQSVAA